MPSVWVPCGVVGCVWAGLGGAVWAQPATATGTFLGQPVSPVMAVELDAATGRTASAPPTPTSSTAGAPSDSLITRPVSAPMYTGVDNAGSTGNAPPAQPASPLRNQFQ